MISLEQDEKAVLLCRRHWINAFFIILRSAIMIAIVFSIENLYGLYFDNTILSEFENYIILAKYIFLEMIWIHLFLSLTDYYLDIWIVTSKKMIFIELKGLFNRIVSSVSLKDIQDITVEVKGIIPTFINYGNLRIETAGTEGEFCFKQIGRPYEVRDIILKVKSDLPKI